MSTASEVWDNSAMESFFSSMKTERITTRVYRGREQARVDVFDYIERFYNPKRRHSTLGCLSPVQFEKLKKLRSVSAKPAAAHPSSHSSPSQRGWFPATIHHVSPKLSLVGAWVRLDAMPI